MPNYREKLTLALTLLCAPMAFAVADGNVLDIRTTVQKEALVVDEDGTETTELVAADTVVPGEVVVYTVAFENVGSEDADNVVITNPLPAELTYVGGSVDSADTRVEFSADGGRTYGAADELTIDEAAGERRAGPEDFTHIRWIVAGVMEPGTSGSAQFRARLN